MLVDTVDGMVKVNDVEEGKDGEWMKDDGTGIHYVH
jgi:hypothetical protein